MGAQVLRAHEPCHAARSEHLRTTGGRRLSLEPLDKRRRTRVLWGAQDRRIANKDWEKP